MIGNEEIRTIVEEENNAPNWKTVATAAANLDRDRNARPTKMMMIVV